MPSSPRQALGLFCAMFPTIASLVLLATPAPALSHDFPLRRIADSTTVARPLHQYPALHAGQVSFVGIDAVTEDRAVFRTPAHGQGPFVVVADRTTRIPNVPGETFFHFAEKTSILDGQVTFAGSEFTDSKPSGVYRGNGGPLEVLHTSQNSGQPILDDPHAGVGGIGLLTDVGQFKAVWFLSGHGALDLVAAHGTPLPGGGTFVDGDFVHNPTYAAGQLAFVAYVSHPDGNGGTYTYDRQTGQIDLVANWTTPMPGQGETFDFFFGCDTDGETVVFHGKHGALGFGGHNGLYRAPVGAGGGGPVELVVEQGQLAPDSPLEFAVFDSPAVEGEWVLFAAGLGDTHAPDVQGLYAWHDGEAFKIVDSTDVLDGLPVVRVDLAPQGYAEGQLACRVVFDDPDGPWGNSYAYYVVDIPSGPRTMKTR